MKQVNEKPLRFIMLFITSTGLAQVAGCRSCEELFWSVRYQGEELLGRWKPLFFGISVENHPRRPIFGWLMIITPSELGEGGRGYVLLSCVRSSFRGAVKPILENARYPHTR